MSNKQPLCIGLFGFGVVGEGLYHVLSNTPSLNAYIKKIAVKQAHKARKAPEHLFTLNAQELLEDPEINVIVELISDADAAFTIVSTALKNGKAVVSANKKMIAAHLDYLIALQEQVGKPFLYEAAACASIPVLRNLEEYYDNDLLQSFYGIVNGSTNYILTKTFEEQLPFSEALKKAQEAGFAEADPRLDVEGYDAQNKLVLLIAHAYGLVLQAQQLLCNGIQSIKTEDTLYAKEKDYQIKLIAQAHKLQEDQLAAFVLPQFISADNILQQVANEYNGLIIESNLSDSQFYYGKGAGGFPTASAVLSDLSALGYDYRYAYKKKKLVQYLNLNNTVLLHVYLSYKVGTQFPKEQFVELFETYSNGTHAYLIGIISLQDLITDNWWKQAPFSLILMPDALNRHTVLAPDLNSSKLELLEIV